MPEEKKEPKVPPLTPVVIEVIGDANITTDTPDTKVIRKD